ETLLRTDMDYDTAELYGLLISLANMLLVSVVMMAVPFICRMVNKNKLPNRKGKRICLWNSIILFVLSCILLAFIETGFIGGIGAFIFYFINKWVFVHQYEIEKVTGYDSNKSIPESQTEQCLSPEDEKPQTRRSFDIYGSDVRLEDDNRTTQPTIATNKPEIKYCSHCGSTIDPATKKCIGCEKQYFKGISIKSVFITLMMVLLATSIVGNVLLSQENRNLTESAETLQKTKTILESKVSDLEKENAQYNDYWVETFDKMNLFDSWIVFIENDGTKLYHKYECSKFVGEDCWAHNVEYAEYIGYRPCSRCID
ncbi:MAG: hypothetical protein IKT60_05640, partial [Clostridia bacterium]|nr:hypothetical protein [Clostridia bacterium]